MKNLESKYYSLWFKSINRLPHVFDVLVAIDVELLGLYSWICFSGLSIIVRGDAGLRLQILWSVGRKCHVEGELEGVVQHSWQILTQQGTRLLQTRVGVDFNEPWLQVFVYHEIIPKYLETLFPTLRIQSGTIDTFQSHFYNITNTILKYMVKIYISTRLRLKYFTSLLK